MVIYAVKFLKKESVHNRKLMKVEIFHGLAKKKNHEVITANMETFVKQTSSHSFSWTQNKILEDKGNVCQKDMQNKHFLTVLLEINADDTDKLRPHIIGKY